MVAGTNFQLIENKSVTIPAGSTSANIEIKILDSKSYNQTSSFDITLVEPENKAIALGDLKSATINIINPLINMELWSKNEAYHRLWAYNTFEDIEVPSSGKSNSDATLGTVFDYSFAFTHYEYRSNTASDPNALGFRNDALWTEENFTKSTNVFNMQDFYAGKGPNTVDMNVSNASAGLYILNAIRFVPESLGATSGKAVIIPQNVKVYQKDETDDDIVNPNYFEVGISGSGTYDETTGIIKLTISFDESSINNGTQVRRFIITPNER